MSILATVWGDENAIPPLRVRMKILGSFIANIDSRDILVRIFAFPRISHYLEDGLCACNNVCVGAY